MKIWLLLWKFHFWHDFRSFDAGSAPENRYVTNFQVQTTTVGQSKVITAVKMGVSVLCTNCVDTANSALSREKKNQKCSMYRVCLVYNYQTNKHFALIFSNLWPGSNVPWMGIIEYVKVDEKFFGSHETFVIAISCSMSYGKQRRWTGLRGD